MSKGKDRLELRFDADVAAGVKKLADNAGVSVNQLLQALSQWAIDHAHLGESHWEKGALVIKKSPGCITFADLPSADDPDDVFLGEHYFTLDFTVRRVVREKERE
jgi:hypothetical protein